MAKMSFNFTVIKKNHILAGAVTLMIVTAGYLNYKYDPTKNYDVEVTGRIEDNLGDAVLVDSSGILSDLNKDVSNYEYSNNGDSSVFTNSSNLENNNEIDLADNSNSSMNNQSNIGDSDGKESEDSMPVFNNSENNFSSNPEKTFKEIDDYFIATRIDRTNNYAEQIEAYEMILDSANTTEEQKNKAQLDIEKINNTRNSIMIAENLIKIKGFDDVVILVSENSINVVVKASSLNNSQVAQLQSVIVNEFSADIADIHIMNYE